MKNNPLYNIVNSISAGQKIMLLECKDRERISEYIPHDNNIELVGTFEQSKLLNLLENLTDVYDYRRIYSFIAKDTGTFTIYISNEFDDDIFEEYKDLN